MSVKVTLSVRHAQALHRAAATTLRCGPYRSADEADALDHAKQRLERAMTKHRVPFEEPA